MKLFRQLLLVSFAITCLPAFACPEHNSKGLDSKGHHGKSYHCQGGIFQNSTIGALQEGYLNGNMSLQRLSRKGDFGLGTLNELNGKLIALDGQFYRINKDGVTSPLESDAKTPFATVIHFSPDKTLKLPEHLDYEDLQVFLDKEVGANNQMQAIRIDGTFSNLRLQSVSKQDYPYRKLTKINKTVTGTDDHKAEGSLIGYRFPDYMGNLNVAGYSFYFIDNAREIGGQVLGLTSVQGTISVQNTGRFKMLLPGDDDFNQLDLNAAKK